MGELPKPATQADIYLHDIAQSLRTMSGRLPAGDVVELRDVTTEPAGGRPEVVHVGGPWYDVAGRRVRGKQAAEAAADEAAS